METLQTDFEMVENNGENVNASPTFVDEGIKNLEETNSNCFQKNLFLTY